MAWGSIAAAGIGAISSFIGGNKADKAAQRAAEQQAQAIEQQIALGREQLAFDREVFGYNKEINDEQMEMLRERFGVDMETARFLFQEMQSDVDRRAEERGFYLDERAEFEAAVDEYDQTLKNIAAANGERPDAYHINRLPRAINERRDLYERKARDGFDAAFSDAMGNLISSGMDTSSLGLQARREHAEGFTRNMQEANIAAEDDTLRAFSTGNALIDQQRLQPFREASELHNPILDRKASVLPADRSAVAGAQLAPNLAAVNPSSSVQPSNAGANALANAYGNQSAAYGDRFNTYATAAGDYGNSFGQFLDELAKESSGIWDDIFGSDPDYTVTGKWTHIP